MDTSDPLDGGGGGELLRRQFQVMYTGSYNYWTQTVIANVHRQLQLMKGNEHGQLQLKYTGSYS